MSTCTLPIVGPAPHSPDWYALHRSPEVVTATGVARIQTGEALEVYAEMAGLVEPFAGNEFTRRGQRYERAILDDYAEAEGCEIDTPLSMFRHPDLYLAATPDAARIEAGEDPILATEGVEAKFSMSSKIAAELGEEGSDWVPDRWLWQVQSQMAVMGWQRVDVACLLYGRLKIYRVPRNDDLVAVCLSTAKEMVERVRELAPPEPNWQHESTLRVLKAMYGVKADVVVDLAPETCDRWEEYQSLGKEIKGLEDRRKACQAQVLAAMGEAGVGLAPGYQLVRSVVERRGYTVEPTSFIQLRQRKK